MVRCAAGVYKPSSSHVFAHPENIIIYGARRHSRRSGDARRFAILRVLAMFRYPLSVGEVVERTGLPRRTVYYYLRQMIERGWVERIGKPRNTGVLYAITKRGVAALERLRVELTAKTGVQTGTKGRRVGSGACVTVGSGVGGCGGCGVPCFVVWEGMGCGWGEVGLRFRWGWFGRVLRGLFGVGVGRGGRVKRVMFYVKGGWVHLDFVSRDPGGELGVFGPWLVRGRAVALAAVALAVLRMLGFRERDVVALWRSLPRLVPKF